MSVTILDRIISTKRDELEESKKRVPIKALRERVEEVEAPRGFRKALESTGAGPRIIAEIKKASPSKGVIRADFDPVAIATSYERGGAAALSVLTEVTYFQGDLEYLRTVHDAVTIPVLRKDFIIDPYQILEARAAGADAILLIVAALDNGMLGTLRDLAHELDMDTLIEVHDEEELERAARLEPNLIGVNNRNLRTFEVSLETTRALLPMRPPGALMVSESGFSSRPEIDRMVAWGSDAFLIGESLMRAADPGEALADLLR